MEVLLGDPDEVDAMAACYERAASQLVEVGHGREWEVQRAQWEAPAADRARRSARGLRYDCERVARELQDLARVCRRNAEWSRDLMSELSDLERRIRSWAAANPPDPTVPGPDAGLIDWWPSSLSVDWQDLAARLRANGAYF